MTHTHTDDRNWMNRNWCRKPIEETLIKVTEWALKREAECGVQGYMERNQISDTLIHGEKPN